MEKKLTIVEISDTLVRITCEGGRVYDIRTRKSYSEVETEKDNIRFYKPL